MEDRRGVRDTGRGPAMQSEQPWPGVLPKAVTRYAFAGVKPPSPGD